MAPGVSGALYHGRCAVRGWGIGDFALALLRDLNTDFQATPHPHIARLSDFHVECRCYHFPYSQYLHGMPIDGAQEKPSTAWAN